MVKRIILLFLILLLPLSYASVFDGDLIEAWNLNGNFNSIVGHSLTNNGAVYNSSGKNKGCYDFESSDTNFLLSDSVSYVPTLGFTVGGWVNIESFTTPQSMLFDKISVFRVGLWGNDKLTIVYYDTSGSSYGYYQTTTNTTAYPLNTWLHIVAVYNSSDTAGNRTHAYINGVYQQGNLIAGTDPGGNIYNGNSIIYVGRQGDAGDRYFDGLIDEVYVWNRTLTEAEAISLYALGDGLFYGAEINMSSDFVNESVYFKKNITGQFNISAVDLSSWNVSIDNILIYNNTAPGYNSTIYNLSYAAPLLSAGQHNITFNIVTPIGSDKIIGYPFYTISGFVNYSNDTYDSNSINLLYLTLNVSGTGLASSYTNSSISYNGTSYNTSKTNDANYIYFSAITTTPSLINEAEEVNFTWNITLPNENYLWNLSQTVKKSNINNCSNGSYTMALNISSWSEETLLGLGNLTWRANFEVYPSGSSSYTNYTFSLSGNNSYGVCIYPNSSNYTVNAIMEYGDGDYSARKYYLRNFVLSNVTQYIYLYNINATLASDIIMTVIDQKDSSRVPNVYVKILRYYPGENTYRTVEIEKTNQYGQTLGKMLLADTFYKFIVENSAGTTLLNSEVQKITADTILIPINTASNALVDYYEVLDLPYDISCTKSTRTCRFTWNNPKNTAITGRMTIYESTGISRKKVYEEETTSVAASIVYTFTNITNKQYFVEAAIIQ